MTQRRHFLQSIAAALAGIAGARKATSQSLDITTGHITTSEFNIRPKGREFADPVTDLSVDWEYSKANVSDALRLTIRAFWKSPEDDRFDGAVVFMRRKGLWSALGISDRLTQQEAFIYDLDLPSTDEQISIAVLSANRIGSVNPLRIGTTPMVTFTVPSPNTNAMARDLSEKP